MDAWLTSSPFWAVGIYISGDSRGCPSQPNLDPDLGQHPARQRLAAAADHARPAGLVHHPRALPAPGPDQPASPGRYAAARSQGRARGRQDASPRRAGAGDRRGQHALVRHRGLRHRQDRLPRVGAELPVRVDRAAARAGLRLRRLLQRRVRHQDARRRPGHPPGRATRCPTSSGSPTGTAARTPCSTLRPQRRLDAAPAGAPVPRRAQRDLRRRHASTSTATGSTSAAARRPAASRRTAAARGLQLHRATPRAGPGNTGALVKAAQCLLTGQKLYAGTVDGVYDADVGRRGPRGTAPRHGLPAAGTVGRGCGSRCCRRARTPLLKFGAASDAVRRLQRALNAADRRRARGRPASSTARTTAAVQRLPGATTGCSQTGVVTTALWGKLQAGLR